MQVYAAGVKISIAIFCVL